MYGKDLTNQIYLIHAHQIGISAVFTHIRKFFLARQIGFCAVFTHVKLLYLTYPVPTHRKDKKTTKSHMLAARQKKENGTYLWARKGIHYSCNDGIEKSASRDHHLSSLGKPRDAKRWSIGQIFHDAQRWSFGRIFYTTLTLMVDSFSVLPLPQ